jgi:hypothetical protein
VLAVGDRGLRAVFHRQIDDKGLQQALEGFRAIRSI